MPWHPSYVAAFLSHKKVKLNVGILLRCGILAPQFTCFPVTAADPAVKGKADSIKDSGLSCSCITCNKVESPLTKVFKVNNCLVFI
jgi:Zn finger protein HypA/HybF involved in hydrogenase expression